MTAPKVTIQEIDLLERDVTLRMPFRFGVVTLREAPQAFVRVCITTETGWSSWGASAEVLAPKWFDKNQSLSNEDNFDQLRNSLIIARDAYLLESPNTAYGLSASLNNDIVSAAKLRGLNGLVANYGPALLDRAILDALCRIYEVSFYDAVRGNLPDIEAATVMPDLAGFQLDPFLAALTPSKKIHARHTVGMVDPIVANDQISIDRVNDGLPETLEEVVKFYGHRYFKIKVGGDIEADIIRLGKIARVLDHCAANYKISLDGNEQYDNADGAIELLDKILETPSLERFNSNIMFIEQPIKRAVALSEDVSKIAVRHPVIIDESDSSFDAFVIARQHGYRGVSSKTCKGFYKSILNSARCAHWSAEAGGASSYFMSAEDLTIQGGIGLQQDLALVNLLGLSHVERNGHHYVHGMSGANVPTSEQIAFAAAHPDLYRTNEGKTFVQIVNGELRIASLACSGFANGVEPEWSSMRQMELKKKDLL